MKNLFKISLFTAGVFIAAQGYANTTQDSTVHKVTHTVKKTAHTVGHKTSELAAKGASAIVDKKYEGKCGPNGETVYINDHSKYYFVNKSGHRVFLKKTQLMDKHDM